MSTFSSLGLAQPLLEAVTELGFQTPTPVQAQAIPYLLQSDGDFIGLAQTGTGKTAAFGLPMLQLIDTFEDHTQGLVIAPTRELCVQIAEEIRRFAIRFPRMRMAVVYGGADIRRQIKDVAAGAQVIVATPGRLRDLIERKAVKLNKVDILVLDEADEMLNMGFKEEIDDILQHTPETKRTWLFSATMPQGVRRIAQEYMQDPFELTIGGKQSGNPDIEHLYVMVKPDDRYPVLRRFLDYDPSTFGLIFCRTRQETQDLADQLGRDGYDADALHGDLNQNQRDRVMQRFKSRRLRLLVATDVAARGIDVQDITHVFHFNIPDDLSFYTHRSGRTGRAGSKGISLIIGRARDKSLLQQLDQRLKLNLQRAEIPTDRDIVTQRLLGRFTTLAATEPHPGLKVIMPALEAELADMSKEDIIARLGTLVGQSLFKRYPNLEEVKQAAPSDFRERTSNTDAAHKTAPVRRPTGEMVRLFINVGRIDLHGVGEFVNFIKHYSDVDRPFLGDIEIHQKHTFFYLDKSQVSKLMQRFSKADLQGRALRVNQDEVRRPDDNRYQDQVKRKSLKAKKGGGKRNF